MSRKRRDVTQRKYAREVAVSTFVMGFGTAATMALGLTSNNDLITIGGVLFGVMGLALGSFWARSFSPEKKMWDNEDEKDWFEGEGEFKSEEVWLE